MNVTMDKQDPKDVVIEWIDHILDRKKWNGTDLARKSGVAPSTILRLLNDPQHRFLPSLKTLQKIADGSGYAIPRKVTDALGAPSTEDLPDTGDHELTAKEKSRGPELKPIRDALAGAVAASPGTVGPRPKAATIRVKSVSSLPASLMPIAREQEIVVDCPVPLLGDDTAFAFYMPDNALEPWIRAGTKMYATRRRDPAAGDWVLVTDEKGRSRVRLLLDIDEEGLSLTRTHPVKEDEKIKFDDLKEWAIVVIVERF
jgi:transcriptional regulator with XRE-family HTH domain